jgi:hypothetical protein
VAWAEVLVLAAGVVVGDWSEVAPEEVFEEEVLVDVLEAAVVDVFEAVVDWLDEDEVVLA